MGTKIAERGAGGGGEDSNGFNFVKEAARKGIDSKCVKSCTKFLLSYLLTYLSMEQGPP